MFQAVLVCPMFHPTESGLRTHIFVLEVESWSIGVHPAPGLQTLFMQSNGSQLKKLWNH